MKRIYFLIFILPIVALFASCTKASGPADGKSIQQNNHLDSTVAISASINGANWQTDSVFAYNIMPSANDSGVVNLEIIATQKNGASPTTMIFYISNFTGAKTYEINPPLNTVTYYVGSTRFFGTSGQIQLAVNQIVVSQDTAYSLTGNFNFIAGADTVTNGIINVAKP